MEILRPSAESRYGAGVAADGNPPRAFLAAGALRCAAQLSRLWSGPAFKAALSGPGLASSGQNIYKVLEMLTL